MMKIGVVADCHIGNHQLFKGRTTAGINERCALTIDAFRASYELAVSLGCQHFYVAGDLFDTDRPSPMILAAVMNALTNANLTRKGPQVWIMKGNHDSNSTAAGDHALGPMSCMGDHIQVHEDWSVTTFGDSPWRIVLLPFKPDAPEWVPELAPSIFGVVDTSVPTLVLSHFGISDAETPPYLKHGAIDATTLESVMDTYGVRVWLSGDWHAYKTWHCGSGALIQQIGALTPTGFDNPGGDDAYGSLLVLDLEDDGSFTSVRHVIPGPRFAYHPSKASQVALGQTSGSKSKNVTYLKVAPGDWPEHEEALNRAKSTGLIRDCILGVSESPRTNTTGSELETEIADIGAASPEEALESYIARMELDADIATELLTVCRAYLTGPSTPTP